MAKETSEEGLSAWLGVGQLDEAMQQTTWPTRYISYPPDYIQLESYDIFKY